MDPLPAATAGASNLLLRTPIANPPAMAAMSLEVRRLFMMIPLAGRPEADAKLFRMA
jgi:hypothetical protein